MTPEARIEALAAFGVTPRQARFLMAVLQHGGVCVPRQYATFAQTAYGHTVNRFFERLVAARYAVPSGCLHNRARVFHLQHRGLYEAIGEPHSPFRRPVAAGLAVERLMRLDSVLGFPDQTWLTTRSEQLGYLTGPCGVALDTLRRASAESTRCLPDRLPMGIDPAGRVTLLFLALESSPDIARTVLRRHVPLLRALRLWTWRVVLPRAFEGAYDAFQTMVDDELEKPLDARTVEHLREAFARRRADREARTTSPIGDDWRGLPRTLLPRVTGLYQRWQRVGDAALVEASSRTIADALAEGHGRVEVTVLPHRYDHLSPLVAASVTGVRGVKSSRGATWAAAQPWRTPGAGTRNRTARADCRRSDNCKPCLNTAAVCWAALLCRPCPAQLSNVGA